jgi:hypothetical protein
MQKVVKGAWVEIEMVVLSKEQRAPQIPEDTKNTPLMMWTRGILQEDEATIGDKVTVVTLSGRQASGKLVDSMPRYAHDFGYPIIELIETGMDLREEIGGQK